jgi:hypothetical protein
MYNLLHISIPEINLNRLMTSLSYPVLKGSLFLRYIRRLNWPLAQVYIHTYMNICRHEHFSTHVCANICIQICMRKCLCKSMCIHRQKNNEYAYA